MTWDRNCDFERTWEKLRWAYGSKSAEATVFRNEGRMAKVAILWIALRNGSRLSEAIEAYNLYAAEGDRRPKVRVRKRGFSYTKDENGKKKRASKSKEPENPVYRLMLVPEEIQRPLIPYLRSADEISRFCQAWFDFNPHSLRYSFVSHLSKKGIAPQIIAKITKHASLNMILSYTSDQKADEILSDGVV